MPGPALPSLDQIQVFLAVVETGSFAAAGRKLGRATSAISYAIANLEQQLAVQLFDRHQTRKPTLTMMGAAVLIDARTIWADVSGLRARINGMLGGLESEVSIVVDVMLPNDRLVDALRAFERQFPTVALRLHVEAMGAVTQLVLSGAAKVGIRGPGHPAIDGLERIGIGGVEQVPVAARNHPLAQIDLIAPGTARNHVQLVLADRSPMTQGRDFGVIGGRSWRLADLGSKHALLLAGIGWGGMPEPMVRADIADGRLKKLALPEWNNSFYAMEAFYRTESPPGPAAAWLIDRFVQSA